MHNRALWFNVKGIRGGFKRLMKRIALVLASLILLSSFAYGVASWWDTDWANRRPIQFIDQNFATGTTIDLNFTGLTALASLDDVRINDSNNGNTDMNRTCSGTAADGNCSFRLPHAMNTNEPLQDETYYIYYNNAAAGTVITGNSSDVNACGWEADQNCTYTVNTGNTTEDEAAFGSVSYELEKNETLSYNLNLLGSRASDLNYSTWVNVNTMDAVYTYSLRNTGTSDPCIIKIDSRLTWIFVDNVGEQDSGVPLQLNTWYNMHIRFLDNDSTCFYTIYDFNGDVAITTSFAPEAADAIDIIRHFISNIGTPKIYLDNVYHGFPHPADGLGAEETVGLSDVNAWRVDGFDPRTQEFPAFNLAVDGNLTLDFNVSHVENKRLTVDINFSTSSTQGTGTVIIEDLNLNSDICPSQVWDTNAAQCFWDWNISGVADNNYFILFKIDDGTNTDFNAMAKSLRIKSAILTARFFDENTFVPLSNISATIGGTVFNSNENGIVSIGLTEEKAATLQVWEDNNYGVRYFDFDINTSNGIDVNIMMLRDINGLDINFTFFEENTTTILANQKIHVIRGDNDANIVSIRTTDAGGRVSFFLEPDTNYVFITPAIRYQRVAVTFNIPKEETAPATLITPYDLSIRRLASRSFLAQSATILTHVFPNTSSFYEFDLNASNIYFGRELQVNFKGNPKTATIQMYLAKVSDPNGILTTILTKRADNLSTQPLILIRAFKTIIGEGTVEVQSVITDDAGLALMSFVNNDEYRLDFFDSSNVFLFSKLLRPIVSEYFVYIDTGEVSWVEPTLEYIIIQGLPIDRRIVFTTTGFDINITVDVNGGLLDFSWLTISGDDGNITFINNCGTGCGFTVPLSDLNSNMQITAKVVVRTASGLVKIESASFVPIDGNITDLITNLKGIPLRRSMGCSADKNEPCFFLVILSVFITIGVIFAAGAGVSTDPSALSIIGVIVLGVFTYLTWIPVGFFILAALAAFATVVLSRRVF